MAADLKHDIFAYEIVGAQAPADLAGELLVVQRVEVETLGPPCAVTTKVLQHDRAA